MGLNNIVGFKVGKGEPKAELQTKWVEIPQTEVKTTTDQMADILTAVNELGLIGYRVWEYIDFGVVEKGEEKYRSVRFIVEFVGKEV